MRQRVWGETGVRGSQVGQQRRHHWPAFSFNLRLMAIHLTSGVQVPRCPQQATLLFSKGTFDFSVFDMRIPWFLVKPLRQQQILPPFLLERWAIINEPLFIWTQAPFHAQDLLLNSSSWVGQVPNFRQEIPQSHYQHTIVMILWSMMLLIVLKTLLGNSLQTSSWTTSGNWKPSFSLCWLLDFWSRKL